jgi:predicted nuclease with RNAse H fold
MVLNTRVFLGFDPGGKNGFGVAVLAEHEVATTEVSTVADAVRWAVSQCGTSVPVAAGVDTLLHWSDGASGWRPADKWLRQTYLKSAVRVASANSLYGAMSLGGMDLALRLRERWPSILMNETHPKMLIPALGGERYADAAPESTLACFADHVGLDVYGVKSGHQLDALLSAWTTLEGLGAGWADLVDDDPALLFTAGRVSYLWPNGRNRGHL